MKKFKLLIFLFLILATNCFARTLNCVFFIDTIRESDTLKIKIKVNPETRIIFYEELLFFRVDTFLFLKIVSENPQIDTVIRVGDDIKQIVRDFQKQVLNREIIPNKDLLHRNIFYYELSIADIDINYSCNKLFSFVEALHGLSPPNRQMSNRQNLCCP